MYLSISISRRIGGIQTICLFYHVRICSTSISIGLDDQGSIPGRGRTVISAIRPPFFSGDRTVSYADGTRVKTIVT
jgi:hypothetical protein